MRREFITSHCPQQKAWSNALSEYAYAQYRLALQLNFHQSLIDFIQIERSRVEGATVLPHSPGRCHVQFTQGDVGRNQNGSIDQRGDVTQLNAQDQGLTT